MEPATILGALLGSYVNKACTNVFTGFRMDTTAHRLFCLRSSPAY